LAADESGRFALNEPLVALAGDGRNGSGCVQNV
jgi:hypothetical protein